jgi:hypothetical protein
MAWQSPSAMASSGVGTDGPQGTEYTLQGKLSNPVAAQRFVCAILYELQASGSYLC